MMTYLVAAIRAAQTADDDFQACLEAHGYKSRWDMPQFPQSKALYEAYSRKLAADQAMHEAFALVQVQS